jgi:hypothetical protein
MESKSRRCSARDIAFYQRKREKTTRFSLLTSAGTRSSEKNDEDDDSGSVAKGDRWPLSTAPDAITIGAGTRASDSLPFACVSQFVDLNSIPGCYGPSH